VAQFKQRVTMHRDLRTQTNKSLASTQIVHRRCQ